MSGQKRRSGTTLVRGRNPAALEESFGAAGLHAGGCYKINQNKDLFMIFHLAETALKKLK
jgi:hypothetical protein